MKEFCQILYPIVCCTRDIRSKNKENKKVIYELKLCAECLGKVSKNILDESLKEIALENKLDLNNDIDIKLVSRENLTDKLDRKYLDLIYFSNRDKDSNCYMWYEGVDVIGFQYGVPLEKDEDKLFDLDNNLKDHCLSVASKIKECDIIIINVLIWYKTDPFIIIN